MAKKAIKKTVTFHLNVIVGLPFGTANLEETLQKAGAVDVTWLLKQDLEYLDGALKVIGVSDEEWPL